jgi:hypothetical protein
MQYILFNTLGLRFSEINLSENNYQVFVREMPEGKLLHKIQGKKRGAKIVVKVQVIVGNY